MELHFWRHSVAPTLTESGETASAAWEWGGGMGMAVVQPARTTEMG